MAGILAPFQDDFMQRAFVVALVVGALCSTMGTYVVLRKLSFIGDGLAHASFAGIAIAYLRGANFYAGAAVATIVTALGIGFVHRRGKVSLDTSIGVLFTGAFALGVFLMSRAPRATVDLQSFLFGSILGVSAYDVAMVVGLGLASCSPSARCGGRCSTPRSTRSSRRRPGSAPGFVDYALLVIIAVTIIVSLQAVGIVLVAALLVTPAAAASQLTKRFVPMMIALVRVRRLLDRRRPVRVVRAARIVRRDDRAARDAACSSPRSAINAARRPRRAP